MSPPRPPENAERVRTHLLLFLLTLKAHRTSECGCWVVCVHRPVLLLLGDLVATMPGLCVWVHVRHMPHAVAAVVPAHGLQRLAAEQPWLVAACYIWWFDFAAVSAYECTVMGTIRVMWVLHFAVAQHAQVRVCYQTHMGLRTGAATSCSCWCCIDSRSCFIYLSVWLASLPLLAPFWGQPGCRQFVWCCACGICSCLEVQLCLARSLCGSSHCLE
jgi:hypothetical protein